MGGNILNKTYHIFEKDRVVVLRLDAVIAITFSKNYKTIIFSLSNGKQNDWVFETLSEAESKFINLLSSWEEIL